MKPGFHTRFRPSPALVVASIALAVSLGGTSVAAVAVLPANSVGTAQLKKNAVNSSKVKDGTLKVADFASAQRTQLKGDKGDPGAKGDKGDKGDTGAKGDKGDPGLAGVQTITAGDTIGAASFGGETASCPAGKQAIAGGGISSIAGVYMQTSHPIGTTGWQTRWRNTTGSTVSVTTIVVCATVL